ncbi:hypothetical protein ACFL4G_06005 [Thermodesulfobacteriota bacterium]
MKSMRRMEAMVCTIALAAVFGLGSMIPVAMAGIPQEINYQGHLTDDSGNPIDGSVAMLFAIYDQETDGTELWSEGPMTVLVEEGMYSVILGETVPLTPTLLDGPCWLEVIVEGEYLVPRERITSTPFTIEAREADTVDGMEGAALEESAEIDADISAHGGDADAHHARYSDGEAQTACAAMEESAEIDGDISAHAGNASAHHAKTTSFAELIDTATDAQIPNNIAIDYAATAGDADTVDGQDGSAFADAAHAHDEQYYSKAEVDTFVSDLQTTIDELTTLLAGVTRVGNDIVFSGANVHIVNGTDTTDGAVNGLGNLIVGYNEEPDIPDRSGSHNIVVGIKHNYSSYGGLVAGKENTISNAYASVCGGFQNVASGYIANVSGGYLNVAAGDLFSHVSGGVANTASGNYSSVSGGRENIASGYGSSISGGHDNVASWQDASVSGGGYNTASGNTSSISGGSYNVASGNNSHVSGGGGATAAEGNEAYANHSAILGGEANVTGDLLNPLNGQNATVSGGKENIASGYTSSVSGGQDNVASGEDASVSGGAQNTANENNSSVSGGGYNTANGTSASISGGRNNVASGDYSFVGGGGDDSASLGNEAYAIYSAILGGRSNVAGYTDDATHATGKNSCISGGASNITTGDFSSVSAGLFNLAAGTRYTSISGGRSNTATGYVATISGGQYNVASGDYSHVSGGGGPTAGDGNEAAADYSAVLGSYNYQSWSTNIDSNYGEVFPGGTDYGWVTLEGLEGYCPLQKDALVLLSATGTQFSWGSGTGEIGYRFVIDGVGQGDATWGQRRNETEATNLEWETWSMSDYVYLSAGYHDIDVQVRSPNNTAHTAVCGESNGSTPGYTDCNLQIEAFYYE